MSPKSSKQSRSTSSRSGGGKSTSKRTSSKSTSNKSSSSSRGGGKSSGSRGSSNRGGGKENMTLQDLFLEQLKDVLNAEEQLMEALPKMAEGASNEDLRQAFEEHISITEQQIERLNQVFETLGEEPESKECMGMKGLIKEAEEVMKEHKKNPQVLDAGLIGAAQKAEHYEIASYGTLRTFAEVLGYTEVADLLNQTLTEEEEADQILTGIAEEFVNEQAAEGEGNDMNDEEEGMMGAKASRG